VTTVEFGDYSGARHVPEGVSGAVYFVEPDDARTALAGTARGRSFLNVQELADEWFSIKVRSQQHGSRHLGRRA
jgi:hypothetical protein